MRKKLREKRGESLVEALVAILIIALSAAMLTSMISAAVRINLEAGAATENVYRQLTAAETGQTPQSGTVTVDGVPVSVEYYGEGGGALTAYGQ